MNNLALIFAFTFFFFSPTLNAARSDEVRNYERLRLLQQATGGGAPAPASNSFETRVNSLLNLGTQATPAYQSQAKLDFEISEKAREEAKEQALLTEKTLARTRKDRIGPSGDTEESLGLGFQPKVPSGKETTLEKNAYVDATEENFQRLLEKQQLEAQKPEKEAETFISQKPIKEKSNILPSLANNPFYFSGNSSRSDEELFETNKPLILTRMVQGAIPVTEAEQILASAGSSEDVILKLMQDYGKSYSEAKAISSDKKS